MAQSDDDDAREAWFIEQIRKVMSRRMGETDVQAYQVAGRFDLNWRGMRRYVSKRPA